MNGIVSFSSSNLVVCSLEFCSFFSYPKLKPFDELLFLSMRALGVCTSLAYTEPLAFYPVLNWSLCMLTGDLFGDDSSCLRIDIAVSFTVPFEAC